MSDIESVRLRPSNIFGTNDLEERYMESAR